MKRKKQVIIVVFLLFLTAILGYSYIYQEHRDIASEDATYSLSAKALIDDFRIDEEAATTKFLNKTLQVTGRLTQRDATTGVLEGVVFFALSENIPNTTQLEQAIIIKGRCIGYDSLLEEVKLDQTSIITN